MTDPTTYESTGGAPTPTRVLTPKRGAGRRPDTPPPPTTLSAALVAALGEMSEVPKTHTAKAGSFEYTYADLSDALTVVRPVLARHGLGVVQDVSVDDDRVRVTTLLVHSSGEKMMFGPVGLPVGTTPQATGSAITYARRYSLLAALGVAADDDDDGQKASVPPGPAPRPLGERGRAAHGGASPSASPSGGAPSGDARPWVADPPDPIHAEQIDEWQRRIAHLQDKQLQKSLRDSAKQAGWVGRYALTETVANAVLDTLEQRVDEVEAAELQQQLPLEDEEEM